MQTHSSSGQVTSRPGAEGSPARAQASAQTLAERRLVQRVFERCDDVIREACRYSSAPPEFLGALVANESGGRADARRFEPAVYRHLQSVARGERLAFGSLTLADLDAEAAELLPPTDAKLHARYLSQGFSERHGKEIQQFPDEVLRQLATSWGYTQIMGYHMVGRAGTVRDLAEPRFHFRVALQLLSEFAADYQLDLRHELPELFCCWNTGRPYGKTFDPDYVANGLRRARIYRRLQSVVMAAR